MRIDIYADLVCPWCYIGKRRLERALDALDTASRPDSGPALSIELRWHPFQLNPHMPAEGMDRDAYLNWKFGGGDRVAFIHDRLARDGAAEGIAFAFGRIRRMPNTLAAHRLLAYAQARDDVAKVVEALFAAYFTDGRDIGSFVELIDIAAACGYAADEVHTYLAGAGGLDEVTAADARARAHGINAVPCYVVDGQYALSGAQPPEVFLRMFDLARQSATLADETAF